ncbi:hypothetical protein CN918_26840 [Priestia megaterium]|nr:hypothetical protein CN918_26840 [Priestia megaterium]
MKLKALILKNFRQYPYAVIPFPDSGFIGIVGENGHGKSTILNAIGYALYGRIKDVLKEHIKYEEAGSREECFVMLFFEHLGVDYVVKRHHTKADECFLKTIDGKPLVNKGAKNLTTYISDTFFKMDYDTFCACYYAQQEDFDALSKLSPAKRRETLTRLLRINTIDKALDVVKDEIKEQNELIASLGKNIEKESEYNENITNATNRIEDYKQQIKEATTQSESINYTYKELLVQRAEGEKDYEHFLRLQREINEKNQNLQLLEERVIKSDSVRLEQLKQAQERYLSISNSIDEYNQYVEEREEGTVARNLHQEKSSLSQQLQGIQQEVEACKTEYKTLAMQVQPEQDLRSYVQNKTSQKEDLFESIQHKNSRVQEANFDIRGLKNQLSSLKDTKEKFEKLGKDSPCPTCERPLGEHFDDTMNHIRQEQTPLLEKGKQIQTERDALLQEIEKDKELYDKMVVELSEKTLQLQEIEKKKERMSYIQQQVNQLNEKYSTLLPRYQDIKHIHFNQKEYEDLVTLIKKTKPLHDEALSLRRSLEEMPILQEKISASKQEASTLRQQVENVKQQFQQLNFDEETYKKLTFRIEDAQTQLHQEKERITRYTYEIKACEEAIKRANGELVAIKDAQKNIASQKRELEDNLFLVEWYKQYKVDIISSLAPELSNIMSDDMERITNGYYTQVELDSDFNIYLYRLGVKKPLSFYSGGEQKLAALLQLLGVSRLLSEQTGLASLDMVGMDEVLGTFDDKRQASTVEQLRNLRDLFPQVLMVAHQELVKEMFDHTLVISTNSKRQSQANWLKDWDDSDIQELIEPYVIT